MTTTSLLLYLYAESPVHAGAAAADGVLDLPIQREAATGYPLVWGQSLKGALRQAAGEAGWDLEAVTAVFGSDIADNGDGQQAGGGQGEDTDEATTPGSLMVGDAQLVALPVPTLRRSFAWATSPLALARLARKHALMEIDPPAPVELEDAEAAAADEFWSGPRGEVLGPCVVDIPALEADAANPVRAWAAHLSRTALAGDHLAPFAKKFSTDLVALDETVMRTLLRECTEFAVRVQLGRQTKTVQQMFTSEYLPAETLLAALITLRTDTPLIRSEASAHLQRLHTLLDGKPLRIGGQESTGKGLMWARLVDPATPQEHHDG
ncbi:type III-B CRISPR module RAMP protein Cmr4 [Nocardiopsis baichengensis]|uniref:type III-B CRISPR module RAMP protein Cmr4 n=1 Tax=Nocardiopsis baichengensis TaxID=280240 RepID=UPI00034851FD|nr:type III-B CRISPR module RAMP protein Cmr4 [Nocardiopsis baichengensis]